MQQSLQGQWSQWQGYIIRETFFLGETCNTLASSQNRARWGFGDDLFLWKRRSKRCPHISRLSKGITLWEIKV